MRRPRWKAPWLLETTRSAIGAKRLRRKVRLTVQMLPDLTFNGRDGPNLEALTRAVGFSGRDVPVPVQHSTCRDAGA